MWPILLFINERWIMFQSWCRKYCRLYVYFLNSAEFNKKSIIVSIIRQMSYRRQQQKKLQPVLEFIRIVTEQGVKETFLREQINRGIVEELLQTSIVASIQSPSALRLIIYELVFLLSQHTGQKIPAKVEGPIPLSKIFNILGSLKTILGQLLEDDDDKNLKALEKRYGIQNMAQNRSSRKKSSPLSSYYNQYCVLMDELQKQSFRSKMVCALQQDSPSEILIDQLQNLVCKKEFQLQTAIREKSEYERTIKSMEKQIAQLQLETRTLFEEKLRLQENNETLSADIKTLVEEQKAEQKWRTLEHSNVKSDSPNTVRYPWRGSAQKLQEQQEIGEKEAELRKLLLSQAITIQALLQ